MTDVFDTKDNFDAFCKVLVPILSEIGVDAGRPDVVEVHNIIPG